MLGRMGVLAGAGLVGPTILAACGGDDDGSGGGGGGGESNALWHENWTGYMDEETVGLFKEETGIDLKYTESYDNYESFAKYQADLATKRNIGPDIITPSNWLAARLIGLAGCAELPLDDIPNAVNLVPDLRTPTWTRTGKYSPAVAVGHDRASPTTSPRRAGADEHGRPVRPRVQGSRRHAHRDARHRRAHDAAHRQRPGHAGHRWTTPTRPST